MNQAVCSFCQTNARPLFKVQDLNRRLSNEVFTYYHCPNCQLIFLSPHPVDLGKYYPDNFHTIPTSLEQTERDSQTDLFKLQTVQKHANSGRLLEVGSSYGGFAYLSKKAGFDVDVIEMDARCCDFLTNIVGVRAINSADPVEAMRSLGKYDVIALWQVIEHLPKPWLTLQSLAEHLNPGGVLILAAPNPNSFQFRLMGRRWPHLDAPRHLTLIPTAVLRSYLKTFQLTLAAETTCDAGGLYWNKFGWQRWLGNFFSSRGGRLTNLIGRCMTKLVSPVERRGMNGSTYTLVFRKG